MAQRTVEIRIGRVEFYGLVGVVVVNRLANGLRMDGLGGDRKGKWKVGGLRLIDSGLGVDELGWMRIGRIERNWWIGWIWWIGWNWLDWRWRWMVCEQQRN
jgi:hypothetical protein